jgi:hypothetical protein
MTSARFRPAASHDLRAVACEADLDVLSNCPSCGKPVFAADEQFMRLHGMLSNTGCSSREHEEAA